MIRITHPNLLSYKGKKYKCVLGKSGVSKNKGEGDGCTPAGLFPLLRVLYRPDRIESLKTKLPVSSIKKCDGWCDDPSNKDYNQPIILPYSASHEVLWRNDNSYNIIVVLGYNSSPIVPYRGSAIFIHCATSSYKPTKGCVALDVKDLTEILKSCSPETQLKIAEF